MNPKILIIEDEERIRRLIRDYLKSENYIVVEAGNGDEGVEKFLESKPDLILLDVMMPKKDGWQTLQEIRAFSDVPVIMLTARSEEYDQLKGYSHGADEYVTKPFSPKVLIARIKALLKRTIMENTEMLLGKIKIDMKSRKVYVNHDEQEMTPKEFEMLVYFAENSGIALSREKILDAVWGYDYFGDLRTVDTHIKRLRQKIPESYIETVRGYGYRFEVRENEN